MNVNALTSAIKAQPIKAVCVVALIAKIGQIAYSQLTNAGATKDDRSCFSKASNWAQGQFIVRNSVRNEDGELETKIAVTKTVVRSAFSVSALAGAAFLARCAVSQIRG